MATPNTLTLRYIKGVLYTEDSRGNITSYDSSNEEMLLNNLLQQRPNSADGRHPDGTDYNTIAWDNLTVSIDTIASNTKYRTARNMELLEHKYFYYATSTLRQLPEGFIAEKATPENAAAFIELITPDEIFICENGLQVAYAMELHHLRNVNKGGHGEAFQKCQACSRYFISTNGNEIYCSEGCKKKAQREQTEQANKDLKNVYRKRITDRYRQQIKRLEAAGNTSTAEKVKEELTNFTKERKRQYKRFKSGEITEQQYTDWLIREYEGGKEK